MSLAIQMDKLTNPSHFSKFSGVLKPMPAIERIEKFAQMQNSCKGVDSIVKQFNTMGNVIAPLQSNLLM
ncbi:hypothetical protein Q2T46_15695 [Thermoanaerobacterium sp. CMT5567-10]|uniref:hypothetical protein n=1 Tax=Thermoanaerobacterium sp. CMT5567-10 TaxID=3061989 RepID=UPI00287F9D67|nr:hypothetical protein [Thermoanaerobacterium sp. CMT5567-10]WLY85464.1 hypothetical protein Q2T46_15695 [Thermoanaerobacterium sp. CMT5567-10]